ncbi:sphingolipid C4-monooxygenase [Ranunculus cassubicifolius]
MTSDETFGILIPIISYWLYGYLLESLGELFPTNRIRNKEEDRQQNKLVSRKHVIIGVLVQQGFQALVACTLYHFTNKKGNLDESGLLMVAISAFQIIIAMIVMDVWQYLLHRIMHQSHYLYKHIHSYHHRVVAPYSYAALYNHPLEGLLVDTLGGAVSYLISGMSAKTSIVFFTFATVKAVDDHSGLHFPWHPFHLLFQNNSIYHDVHHHHPSFNFSQPFCIFWDIIFGTNY